MMKLLFWTKETLTALVYFLIYSLYIIGIVGLLYLAFWLIPFIFSLFPYNTID